VIGSFFTSVYFAGFEQIHKTILHCYYIDNEMYTGNQRYTEDFLQDYMDDLYDLCGKIITDKTWFGITCKKGIGRSKIGADVAAEFEDPDDYDTESDEIDDLEILEDLIIDYNDTSKKPAKGKKKKKRIASVDFDDELPPDDDEDGAVAGGAKEKGIDADLFVKDNDSDPGGVIKEIEMQEMKTAKGGFDAQQDDEF
jgi:hypothetical protein